MPRQRRIQRPRIGDRLITYGLQGQEVVVPGRGDNWFIDVFNGSAGAPGTSWDQAIGGSSAMATALDRAQTHDRIFMVGDVREEIAIAGSGLTDLNLKFDVGIVGAAAQHHPDQPGSGAVLYDPASAMWRPPASPTSATPLLNIYGRGWSVAGVAFDCPVDAAAVVMRSNALSGTSEYDAGHTTFKNCSFQQGLVGIQDIGGVINVLVDGCVFRILSPTGGTGILSTSTAVRLPQYWRIQNNFFAGNGASGGNECHIDTPLSGSLITRNVFGTVEGTALYIDLTGGDDNDVCYNSFAGVYNTSDYVAGTSDRWFGNNVAVISTQAPNGFTITVPAAP